MSDKAEHIRMLAEQVQHGDPARKLEATTQFRKLLSIENTPPIQEVVNSGVVPHLVQFLTAHNYPKLQFEAAWALTNIASGTPEQTSLVIELGSLPLLKDLLKSPDDEVRDQAIWAIGNVAGDSPECRDLVLGHEVLSVMIGIIESGKANLLRNATWALSNLCRGKPQPEWEEIAPAVPVLCKLVYSSDDEVLTDACWALSYLSDGPNERIQAVLETGICRRIVELLLHPSHGVQTPALRTIGNVVTGDEAQTQQAINCQVVPCLASLLNSSKKGIRKEACWTISNITAGTRRQIQTVIDAAIVPKLVNLMKGSDFEIKKEAAWALSNATTGGTSEQIRYLVEQGVIEQMCELLISTDTRMITVALEGLENILKIGEPEVAKSGVNPYCTRMESCSGLDKLENLQHHANNDVYEKAVSIIEEYFGTDEDQNITPNLAAGNAFQFGTNSISNFCF